MDQPARARLSVFSKHLFLVRCPKFLIRLKGIVARQPLHLHRTALEGGLAAPGMIFVGHAAMINLSAINRLVSMLDKVLRQSDDFWIQFTEVGRVLDHTDPVGSGARHQAGTGGTANGLLAVGPVAHAVRRQFVEIRRLGDRGTIATKLRPQVVDGDEKGVRTAVGTFGNR